MLLNEDFKTAAFYMKISRVQVYGILKSELPLGTADRSISSCKPGEPKSAIFIHNKNRGIYLKRESDAEAPGGFENRGRA